MNPNTTVAILREICKKCGVTSVFALVFDSWRLFVHLNYLRAALLDENEKKTRVPLLREFGLHMHVS